MVESGHDKRSRRKFLACLREPSLRRARGVRREARPARNRLAVGASKRGAERHAGGRFVEERSVGNVGANGDCGGMAGGRVATGRLEKQFSGPSEITANG